MINKIIDYIKKYGFINVIKFILSKLYNKLYLYFLKKKAENNKIQMEFKFLENFKTEIKFFDFDKKKIIKFYNENEKLKTQVTDNANKILEHRFNFLSDREYFLDKEIKWNKDFKSGFTWENKFYKDIKVVDLNNNVDVKVPWELSRFQHIFTLGKAYFITKDIKYYQEFKDEVLDWIDKNPIYMSVNWTCTMDIGIRAINLIFGYFLFKDLVDNDKEFLNELNNSLYNHGKYIIRNLEKGLGFANNHYLSDLNGLVFLGLYFKKLNNREINKWLDTGIKELEKEMFIENNRDGSNYETSTSYHRLVTELMFYPMIVCEKNNIDFSTDYKNLLEKMFEFMGYLTKENGKIPLIGDVDNGRLVILSDYYNWDIDDVRHIISLGGEYFNNDFLKEVSAKVIEDKLWLFNSTDVYKEKFNKKSKDFKEGGYYLLNNENIYCLVRCGELSVKGQGGHSHNDQLSIELNVKGEDFIVDTGTGVYTADKDIRNLFRSTKMHNTVVIKDYEQNKFNENELFSMAEETFSKCVEFSKNYFNGEHYGYLKKIGVVHNRKIRLEEKEIIIEDSLKNSEGVVCFNLNNDVSVFEEENNIILEKNNIKILLKLENKNYKIVESFVSPKYGEIIKSKRIEIYFNNVSKIKIEVGE